jgi:hypothetical protein
MRRAAVGIHPPGLSRPARTSAVRCPAARAQPGPAGRPEHVAEHEGVASRPTLEVDLSSLRSVKVIA